MWFESNRPIKAETYSIHQLFLKSKKKKTCVRWHTNIEIIILYNMKFNI